MRQKRTFLARDKRRTKLLREKSGFSAAITTYYYYDYFFFTVSWMLTTLLLYFFFALCVLLPIQKNISFGKVHKNAICVYIPIGWNKRQEKKFFVCCVGNMRPLFSLHFIIIFIISVLYLSLMHYLISSLFIVCPDYRETRQLLNVNQDSWTIQVTHDFFS